MLAISATHHPFPVCPRFVFGPWMVSLDMCLSLAHLLDYNHFLFSSNWDLKHVLGFFYLFGFWFCFFTTSSAQSLLLAMCAEDHSCLVSRIMRGVRDLTCIQDKYLTYCTVTLVPYATSLKGFLRPYKPTLFSWILSLDSHRPICLYIHI